MKTVTMTDLRLLVDVAQQRVYHEAGHAWNTGAGNTRVTHRMDRLITRGLAEMPEEPATDAAGRPLYAPTSTGERWLASIVLDGAS